jgi:lipopolysaccharide export LptBFGC system permease protein LptF
MIALFVYFIYSNAITIMQNYTTQSRLPFSISVWLIHAVVLAIAIAMLVWRNGIHRSWRVALGDLVLRARGAA